MTQYWVISAAARVVKIPYIAGMVMQASRMVLPIKEMTEGVVANVQATTPSVVSFTGDTILEDYLCDPAMDGNVTTLVAADITQYESPFELSKVHAIGQQNYTHGRCGVWTMWEKSYLST